MASSTAEPWFDKLDKLNRRATLWLARIAGVCLTVMMLLTFADVTGRFFRHPIVGATEVTALLMGLLVIFPLGFITTTREHLRADFVYTRFSPRVKDIFDLITFVISMGVSALISIRLLYIVRTFYESGRYTQSIGIYLWPDALLMALASVLVITSIFFQIIAIVQRLVTGTTRDDSEPSIPTE